MAGKGKAKGSGKPKFGSPAWQAKYGATKAHRSAGAARAAGKAKTGSKPMPAFLRKKLGKGK